LETEISKTGEVVVEGHAIGRLDGFRFAPESTTGGTEAKALGAAAQKALAGEIEARATRLSQAPDSQFVLAGGGTLRWVGEAVAKLTAGDNILRPRVRILSDEHLTGAALEHVQTRLDLWTRTHIERLLAPLFVLGAADDVTGLARGIAYQVVEALGVLERSKVAEDVKSLDQAARAILRKHGVRFGAFHIYVPSLLKPGPRSLAAELWALKHGGPDVKGLDEVQRLASSGRTSFPADKETPKALYRASGYRVCGERAVRVDILERLADLIRPALSWREGTAEKPAGAFDGRSFTVTQAMTSLTGSSGEDFASILRALGYRMERRPKPPELPSEPPAAAPAGEVTTASATETEVVPPANGEVAISPADAAETPIAPDAESIADAPVETDAAVEHMPVDDAAVADDATAVDAAPIEVSEPTAVDAPAIAAETPIESGFAEPAASELAPGETSAAKQPAAAPAEEQQSIEVWRPGGRSDDRRPRRHPRGPRRRDAAARPGETPAPAADGAAAAAPADASAAPAAEPSDGEGRRGRRHGRHDRQDRQNREAPREGRPPERQGRPDRDQRRDRGDRGDRRDRRPRPDRRDRGDENRVFATTEKSPRERGNREPDPNSPFAKLAALKAQLEAGDKEKR
jgi:ATP-dependent RNA helicase SUPV3L1/SUV3